MYTYTYPEKKSSPSKCLWGSSAVGNTLHSENQPINKIPQTKKVWGLLVVLEFCTQKS